MPRDPRKYLYDIRQAVRHVLDFVAGKNFEDYQGDLLLRSGVERQLEIIGEALNQLAQVAPKRLRGFQNIAGSSASGIC
jgi:uncharacterized protein with HEPN domain